MNRLYRNVLCNVPIAIRLNFLLLLVCARKSCQGCTFSVKLSDSIPMMMSPRPLLVLLRPCLTMVPAMEPEASRSLSLWEDDLVMRVVYLYIYSVHLNCKLLVPLSRERRPMLSTLELLSSLILLPVLRLLVLLHRRFQDCNQIHQRYHVMSREIRIEIRCHLAPRGR